MRGTIAGLIGLLFSALGLTGCNDQAPVHLGAGTSPLQHDPFFPIAAVDGGTNPHAVACNSCHGAFDTFKKFDCLSGCHARGGGDGGVGTDPLHGGVANYQYQSPACYQCHPRGVAPGGGANHTFFPIAPGDKHGGQACATCHTDPSNKAVFSCISGGCHPQMTIDTAHVGVTNYKYASPSCLGCHPNGQVPGGGVDHARFFPIAMADKHGNVACASCHTDATAKAKFSCTSGGCHAQPATDPVHVVANYKYDSAACLSCHPNGLSGLDHTKDFPIGPKDYHANITCKTCHTDPANPRNVSCTTGNCHPMADTGNKHPLGLVPNYMYSSGACVMCHPNGTIAGVDHSKLFPIAMADKHTGIACATCHADVNNRKNVTCAAAMCHAQAAMTTKHGNAKVVSDANRGYAYSSPLCLKCHADSQVDRVATHDAKFRVSSGDHHRPCLQCHDTLRKDKAWAADFTAHNCIQCHPNGVGG